uniref:Uncharacterized protein n=1 Tax=Arundo donax TaxID=35708 RepID=A0A0A9F5A2_ARUDO
MEMSLASLLCIAGHSEKQSMHCDWVQFFEHISYLPICTCKKKINRDVSDRSKSIPCIAGRIRTPVICLSSICSSHQMLCKFIYLHPFNH